MRVSLCAATLVLLVCAACALPACKTLNMGSLVDTGVGPIVSVEIPAGMRGGQAATWIVSWPDRHGPFTISMDMGGGATENVPAGTPATTPLSQTFTMVNPSATEDAVYTYTVRVTDANNQVGVATATYTVGPPPNSPPVIESAVFAEATSTLVVTTSDPDDGETLTVGVVGNNGVLPDAASKVASATGPLSASFVFSAADFFSGATGSADVTVTDSAGAAATQTGIPIVVFGVGPSLFDVLYAIPLETSVAVGEPVTVVVVTGVPAHPFQYMNGVGLTIESDAEHRMPGFYDNGLPGGGGEADGFWAAMNPSGGFLMLPDSLDWITATDIGGGRERWDFVVVPVGGSDMTTASGALYNETFTFSEPGVKHFGFQQFDVVKRTYYSDSTSTEYYWGDISNAGAPTVTVHE